MQWWRYFWQILTKPSEEIENLVERQRAALFSAMLFFMTALLIVTSPIFYFLPDRQDIGMVWLGLVIFLNMTCYFLSRTKYHKLSVRLYIWLIGIIVFYVGMTIQYANMGTVLSFSVILIMMSALILSQRETLFIIAIIELILLLLNLQIGLDIALINTAVLVMGMGILILIFTTMNNAYRNQALDSETRYRELMNANNEGIMVIDAQDARILDINPAIVNLMGYQAENLIGRYPIEFVPEKFKALIWKIWNERTKNTSYEIQVLHASGHSVYVDVTLKSYSYRQSPAYVLTIVDTTERKQTEKLLLESEKRFRAIFNQSFQQIGVLGKDGLILEINDTASKALGVETQELFGKRLWNLEQLADTPEAKETIEAMVARAATGEVIHKELNAKNADGNSVYLDFSLKPVVADNSEVTMLIVESRDITAQRQAEQKRLEYELRYQALFDHTVDAVFIIDLEGKVITTNDHGLAILGHKMEEVVGKPAETFIIPNEHTAMTSKLNQLQSGQQIPGVYERGMRRKDGTEFRAEVTAMMVHDAQGQPLYIQSLVRDITERKQVEAERSRLLNAIRSSLNEIFIFDADTLKFQFVNTGAKRNLGYSMAELMEMTPLSIKPLFNAEEFAALIDPLIQHQQEKIMFETIHQRKDGSAYPVEVNLQLVEFANDRTFLAIVTDISERKRLEQEKFEVRIEQERTRVLQSFIEQASHHFRTPITNLKTSTYLLQRVQDNPEKYQWHMQALNRETERLKKLIDDLLMVLRLQKEDTEYEITHITVSQFLNEIRTIQEGQPYYQDYEWRWSLSEDDYVVVGDKQFLSHALLNIIDNAVCYSRHEDVISIRTYYDKQWVIIEIEDTGIGISKADLPHVFDEFYRSHTSMEQDSTRSGLGLTIAQQIIKRHRGMIYIQSQIGEGTQCQILLPRNLEWEDESPTLPERIR